MGVGRYCRRRPDITIVAAEPRYGELVYGLRNLDEGFVPELYYPSTPTPGSPSAPVTRSAGPVSCWTGKASSPSFHRRHPACRTRPRRPRRQDGPGADIALVVCDGGWKYLSTGAYTADLDSAEDFLDGQVWA